MITAILGKKIKQTRQFTPEGKQIPVTQIEAGPCIVVQVKTAEKDGYWAYQLGFDYSINRHITNPTKGHLKKTGKGNLTPRFLREVRLVTEDISQNQNDVKVGDQINLNQVLQVGNKVKITGTTKGKGFAGVVKRHGFAGGPRTHGQSDRERAPGSIGQSTTPGRVYKGKRMAGRMGGKRVTISGLQVVGVDPEKNLLTIKGLVPGNTNSYLIIRKQNN